MVTVQAELPCARAHLFTYSGVQLFSDTGQTPFSTIVIDCGLGGKSRGNRRQGQLLRNTEKVVSRIAVSVTGLYFAMCCASDLYFAPPYASKFDATTTCTALKWLIFGLPARVLVPPGDR